MFQLITPVAIQPETLIEAVEALSDVNWRAWNSFLERDCVLVLDKVATAKLRLGQEPGRARNLDTLIRSCRCLPGDAGHNITAFTPREFAELIGTSGQPRIPSRAGFAECGPEVRGLLSPLIQSSSHVQVLDPYVHHFYQREGVANLIRDCLRSPSVTTIELIGVSVRPRAKANKQAADRRLWDNSQCEFPDNAMLQAALETVARDVDAAARAMSVPNRRVHAGLEVKLRIVAIDQPVDSFHDRLLVFGHDNKHGANKGGVARDEIAVGIGRGISALAEPTSSSSRTQSEMAPDEPERGTIICRLDAEAIVRARKTARLQPVGLSPKDAFCAEASVIIPMTPSATTATHKTTTPE
jgi:hypothetical protein